VQKSEKNADKANAKAVERATGEPEVEDQTKQGAQKSEKNADKANAKAVERATGEPEAEDQTKQGAQKSEKNADKVNAKAVEGATGKPEVDDQTKQSAQKSEQSADKANAKAVEGATGERQSTHQDGQSSKVSSPEVKAHQHDQKYPESQRGEKAMPSKEASADQKTMPSDAYDADAARDDQGAQEERNADASNMGKAMEDDKAAKASGEQTEKTPKTTESSARVSSSSSGQEHSTANSDTSADYGNSLSPYGSPAEKKQQPAKRGEQSQQHNNPDSVGIVMKGRSRDEVAAVKAHIEATPQENEEEGIGPATSKNQKTPSQPERDAPTVAGAEWGMVEETEDKAHKLTKELESELAMDAQAAGSTYERVVESEISRLRQLRNDEVSGSERPNQGSSSEEDGLKQEVHVLKEKLKSEKNKMLRAATRRLTLETQRFEDERNDLAAQLHQEKKPAALLEEELISESDEVDEMESGKGKPNPFAAAKAAAKPKAAKPKAKAKAKKKKKSKSAAVPMAGGSLLAVVMSLAVSCYPMIDV